MSCPFDAFGLRPARARRRALGLSGGLVACVRLAALFVWGGLVACASLPPQAPAERVHAGRFSAIASLDDRQENLSGRFVLAIRGESLTLDLASPLGTTLARVETGPDGARFVEPGSPPRELRGASAEALAEQALGFALPASGIADWIVGRPVARRPARTTLQDGRISAIDQDGWTIRVLERFASNDLPRRLSFERPAHDAAPAIRLQLVLDEPAG
ncbi:MAG: lipoprotein insertase outer membrane protein LolB [Burkholderiaceae bacterium]